MWIGLDDTDSPRGGCTTWLLSELLDLARSQGIDLIGEPRLVRLNPNVPWKTRGNASLSAHFGRGQGPRRQVGWIAGQPVWSFRRGQNLSPDRVGRFRDAAWRCILERAPREPGTDPAFVVAARRLPAARYWEAVREVVSVGATVDALSQAGTWWRVRGARRGLIGAAASVAWSGRRGTWELTAYRSLERWGTPRSVDARSVRRAARRHPSLFLCHDPRTRRLLVAPHTPCPILFGLRGTDPEELLRAFTEIRSEPVDRWVLFRTNQATGDHLVRRTARELRPYTSARVLAIVREPPVGLPGGHARFRAEDLEGNPLECLAFEPTKTLPRAVRALAPGDRVDLAGSRGDGSAFRLESLRVVRLVPRSGPPRGPICPVCGRQTRSLGRERGFRCAGCRRRWPPESALRPLLPMPRLAIETHPTPSARRHLHPLAPEPGDSGVHESF